MTEDGPDDPGEVGSDSPAERPSGPSIAPEVFAALEATLLGEAPYLTRPEVIERAGVTYERAHELWLALGFTPPESDEDRIFVQEDVEALKLLASMIDQGLVDQRTETSLARSMGRSFARLAEWEIAEVASMVLDENAEVDPAAVTAVADLALPALEQVQRYIWRRHLAGAAGRLLLRAGSDEDAVRTVVGFADIVGYTRMSRSLSADELAAMVETFESTVTSVIADHGGRIIKTIGDEVLYAADDPLAAARIALVLAERHEAHEEFPQVRVGMAYGDVLSRLGDVFGEVVNIAARLTSLARPGRTLMNRDLADVLREHEEEFRVRRARTTPVKGYSRLETWALKRPKVPRERENPLEALESLAERLPRPLVPRRVDDPEHDADSASETAAAADPSE